MSVPLASVDRRRVETAPERIPTRSGGAVVSAAGGDGGARGELARPDKLNALTLATLDGLVATARELRSDRSLRGIVLTGQGPSFCAGLDFATVMKDPAGVARAFAPRPWRGTPASSTDAPPAPRVHGCSRPPADKPNAVRWNTGSWRATARRR